MAVGCAVVEASVAVADTSVCVAVTEPSLALFSAVVGPASCFPSTSAISSRRTGPDAGAASAPKSKHEIIKVMRVDHRILARIHKRNQRRRAGERHRVSYSVVMKRSAPFHILLARDIRGSDAKSIESTRQAILVIIRAHSIQ